MEDSSFPSAVTRDGDNISTNTDRLVPWWSIMKSVLAAATIRLADQDRLQLDAHFKNQPFTIRQLLQHTAGVRDYSGGPYQDAVANGEPAWTVEELLFRINAEKLNFVPGNGWSYSNVGYLFIRQLIEEVLDTDIGSALKAIVFDPLGLSTPRVAITPADLDHTLWGNVEGYDPNWVYHGLLIGSPADAVRFLHKLHSTSYLSNSAFSSMLTEHHLGNAILSGRPWVKAGYGLGLMMGTMTGVGRAYGHSGVGTDTVSALYHFPQLDPPATVATFAKADDEGLTEHEAVRIATE